MRLRGACAVILVGFLATSPAFGQRSQLKVGDAAPGLDIEKWVKGDETSIEPGNVYIVEFWATWCGPCRATMPHLTELQEQYGDDGLIVIGVSDEEVDVVDPWVQTQGRKMGYNIAVDRRDSTKRAWMNAAGLKGIPAAFIVDREGKIAFIGNPHPRSDGPEMESILKKVLRGRYDPKLEREAAPILKAARDARKTRTWRLAIRQYDEVIDKSPQVFADVAIERFEMMIVDMDDPAAAYEYASKVLIQGLFAEDAGALRSLARTIVTEPRIAGADRDLSVAAAAADQAVKLSGRDAPSLSTLALVKFHLGEQTEAVRLQRRAWMLARPKSKPAYKRVLESYREAAERASIRD